MNWKNIRLIFQREIRDQLRDRRTLFMVAVLPLFLYPALGIGMVQMQVTFSEKTRIVALIGEDDLPQTKLIDGDHFAEDLFENKDDAAKIRVVTERLLKDSATTTPDAAESPQLLAFLQQAVEKREQILELGRLGRRRQHAEDAKNPKLADEINEELAKQKLEMDGNSKRTENLPK